jgi:hypothetical protein
MGLTQAAINHVIIRRRHRKLIDNVKIRNEPID